MIHASLAATRLACLLSLETILYVAVSFRRISSLLLLCVIPSPEER